VDGNHAALSVNTLEFKHFTEFLHPHAWVLSGAISNLKPNAWCALHTNAANVSTFVLLFLHTMGTLREFPP